MEEFAKEFSRAKNSARGRGFPSNVLQKYLHWHIPNAYESGGD
jgi:hypothetical protein